MAVKFPLNIVLFEKREPKQVTTKLLLKTLIALMFRSLFAHTRAWTISSKLTLRRVAPSNGNFLGQQLESIEGIPGKGFAVSTIQL
jgi:hypothetical protein